MSQSPGKLAQGSQEVNMRECFRLCMPKAVLEKKKHKNSDLSKSNATVRIIHMSKRKSIDQEKYSNKSK